MKPLYIIIKIIILVLLILLLTVNIKSKNKKDTIHTINIETNTTQDVIENKDSKKDTLNFSVGSPTKDGKVVNIQFKIEYEFIGKTDVSVDSNAILIPEIINCTRNVLNYYLYDDVFGREEELSALIYEELFNQLNNKGFKIYDFKIFSINSI